MARNHMQRKIENVMTTGSLCWLISFSDGYRGMARKMETTVEGCGFRMAWGLGTIMQNQMDKTMEHYMETLVHVKENGNQVIYDLIHRLFRAGQVKIWGASGFS